MGYRLRERWPTVVGILAAGGVLGAAALLDQLTVVAGGIVAVVLVVGLAVQIWLDRRSAVERERRLVRNSANLRLAGAQLERLASVDPLTGLPNRRAIFDQLGVEYRRALRYDRDLAVLMIDIDDFKAINDGSGHPFGDRVLAEVAYTLRGNLRESDHVGRYGGEEFVVLLPETDGDRAAVAADKLRQAVETLEVAAEAGSRHRVGARVTISIGVAALPVHPGEDENALVRRADEALYGAKTGGKNQVHLHGHGLTSAGEASAARE